MAQDTRSDLAVTRLNPWLSYALYLPYETHTKMEQRPLEERPEIELQLMELNAAARSLPHKLWQERRLQERLGCFTRPARPRTMVVYLLDFRTNLET